MCNKCSKTRHYSALCISSSPKKSMKTDMTEKPSEKNLQNIKRKGPSPKVSIPQDACHSDAQTR
jgi:hypothetical protein